MKISDDQNFVEVDGVKGEFVELKENSTVISCNECMFIGKTLSCGSVKCQQWQRKDSKDGYFKEVEK